MTLLIDTFEEAAAYIRERKKNIKNLEEQYRKAFDLDLKKEMLKEKHEIGRKRGEVTYELLLNLEEFRSLKKYFPDLLSVYMEDEEIGKVLAKKSWLLDYTPIPPQAAAEKLRQLQAWRSMIKEIRMQMRGRVGAIDTRALVERYPFLHGYLKGQMAKDDIEKALVEIDKTLIREGWLVLINDEMIGIPANKFMARIGKYSYEEVKGKTDLAKTRGKGTVAEVSALKKLEKMRKKKSHYENILTQLLLSNPNYLRRLKSSKNWLSRKGANQLQKFASDITPHTVKEMSWLREMKERLSER